MPVLDLMGRWSSVLTCKLKIPVPVHTSISPRCSVDSVQVTPYGQLPVVVGRRGGPRFPAVPHGRNGVPTGCNQ